MLELARGGELFDRIVALGFLYERDVGVIIRRVLEAVQYLHSKNIIHRDLKVIRLLCNTLKLILSLVAGKYLSQGSEPPKFL